MPRRWLNALALCAALTLAACGARGTTPPTQTAIVLVEGTSPLTSPATDTAAPPTASAPPSETTAPAATVTTPAATAAAGLDALSGDPLLRTYRSLVAIQVNAALVAETVGQVQAGRIDDDEMPVAALALGALTQSVDDGLPGVSPPPALAAQWQAAVARHEEVKALGAQWLIGQATVAEVAAALQPIRADLQRLLAEADSAVAAEYGVSAAELTEHRERMVAAVGGVFE